jgi:DNA-binding NarL/FixJ family response regulator
MQEQTQSEVVQNNKNIRIMIVDDHPLMRQALKNLLESQKDFKIIKEAGDG